VAKGNKISAYVLTFNNERTIGNALKSLSFADEILVVDSGSSDGTLGIVAEYGARVLRRDWSGFRDQYQFAQDNCLYDWVFFLDADEEVSGEMADSVLVLVSGEAVGYFGFRRTFFIDHWIRHGGWRRDREIRLYRRSCGSWCDGLHSTPKVSGVVGSLAGLIYHDTYANIEEQLATLNRYSSESVEDYVANSKRVGLRHLVGNPLWSFFKEYFLLCGFLDGIPGLVIAMNNMGYVFNKYAKLWEYYRVKGLDVDKLKGNKE